MKLISNKLYEQYTKTVIGFHQYIPNITKEQLYEVFKFHCANLRVLNETVEYYSELQEENKKLKEDISFCLKSIKQEMEMSTDSRTKQEMLSCYQILSKWSDKQ